MCKPTVVTIAGICLTVVLSASPAVSFALTAQDQTDLREFVAAQRLDAAWNQVFQHAAVGTARWVRQFAEEDIAGSKDLLPDQRAKAKRMLDRYMPAVQDDLTVYLKSFDTHRMSEYLAVNVYGSLLTMSDVRAITAFYKTPTGKKFLREGAAVLVETRAGDKDAMTKHFTQAEIASIADYSASSAGQHLQAVAPQVQARMKAYYESQVAPEVHALERRVVGEAVAAAH